MLPVKIGDVIEFAPLKSSAKVGGEDGSVSSRALTTERVMDVNPVDEGGDGECVVRVSPYEPMQSLDLKSTYYKVVYEAGELPPLSTDMIGWELEVESMDTRNFERATVKRVDCDINCAFVVFTSGRKEWLDLTLFRIKVVGHPGSDGKDMGKTSKTTQAQKGSSPVVTKVSNSPVKPDKPEVHSSHAEAPRVIEPKDVPQDEETTKSPNIRPMTIPSVDPDDHDWWSEGSHVELCDSSGSFLEGAAFCSKTGPYLQLYNERRDFFEVAYATQPFKVVIHGLQGLKSIPMGSLVEVYSPMAGEFRSSVVLKAAVLGHLTPIRCTNSKAVEWVDLTSQTFKLVFIPRLQEATEHQETPPSIPQEMCGSQIDVEVATHPSFIPKLNLQCHLHKNQSTPCSLTEDTNKTTLSPRGLQPARRSDEPQHRDSRHQLPRSHLEYPVLHVGQAVEIFDDQSRQYQKYKLIAFSDWDAREYVFEAITSSDSYPQSQTIVSTLSKLRTRVMLQSARWEEYRSLLVGHRVDVYDRVGKNVMSGTVQAIREESSESEGSSDNPLILVRYKDNRKAWVDLRTTKVKLRLSPTNKGTQSFDSAGAIASSSTTAESATASISIAEDASSVSDNNITATMDENTTTADKMVRSILSQGLARIPSGVEPNEENGDPVVESTSASLEPSGQQTLSLSVDQPPSIPRRASAGKRMPPLRRRASQAAEETKPAADHPHLSTDPLVRPLLPVATAFEEHALSSKATAAIITPLDFSQLAARHGGSGGEGTDSMEAVPRHTTPPASSPTSVQATGAITPSLTSPLSVERAALPVGAVEAAREPNLSLLASDHEHEHQVEQLEDVGLKSSAHVADVQT